MVILFLDITETHKTEQLLRRFATVVTDSNDAILLLDFKGKILAWNKGARLLYGYTEARALTMNIQKIIPRDKHQETVTLMDRLSKGKTIKPFRTLRKPKDGKVVDIWLTATPLMEHDGKPECIATTERKISELKTG